MQRIKSITVKVYKPTGGKPETRTHTAPSKRIFIQAGIDALLQSYADAIEMLHPGVEYRMVALAGGCSFNFMPVAQDKHALSANAPIQSAE